MSDNVVNFYSNALYKRHLKSLADMCQNMSRIYDSLNESYQHLNDMEEAVDRLQDEFEDQLATAVEAIGAEKIPQEVFDCSRNVVPIEQENGEIIWEWRKPEHEL
jgi:predicted SpoU family rRNA methylase